MKVALDEVLPRKNTTLSFQSRPEKLPVAQIRASGFRGLGFRIQVTPNTYSVLGYMLLDCRQLGLQAGFRVRVLCFGVVLGLGLSAVRFGVLRSGLKYGGCPLFRS